MNSASQDFPYHLGVLRERMLHPTNYELAVNCFLEEFKMDPQSPEKLCKALRQNAGA